MISREDQMRNSAKQMAEGMQGVLGIVSNFLTDAKTVENAQNTDEKTKKIISDAFAGPKGIANEVLRAQRELNNLADKWNSTVKR